MFKYKDENENITPFGRGLRTFVQAFVPTFVLMAGLSQVATTGVVDTSLLIKGLIAGGGAGAGAVWSYYINLKEEA